MRRLSRLPAALPLCALLACAQPDATDIDAADRDACADILIGEYAINQGAVRTVDESVASIAIVADTSGSMSGRKNAQLREALGMMVDRLDTYRAQGRAIEAGLYGFTASGAAARTLVPFGAFSADRFRDEIGSLPADGGTPLGRAIAYAERELDEHATGRRSLLLLTDGRNERGRNPVDVFGCVVEANRERADAPTQLYVIAFETDVDYFSGLMDHGAYVRDASGALELQETLLGNIRMILEAPYGASSRNR